MSKKFEIGDVVLGEHFYGPHRPALLIVISVSPDWERLDCVLNPSFIRAHESNRGCTHLDQTTDFVKRIKQQYAMWRLSQ